MSHHYIHFGTIIARGSRTRGSSVASGSLRPFGPLSGSNVARGSSVASGSLRPFGPESGSNVTCSSSVLYLTRGDKHNVTPLYGSWEQYSSGVSHALMDTQFECSLRLQKTL